MFHLGDLVRFVWDLSFRKFRLGSHAWVVGDHPFEMSALHLSLLLDIVRLGPFVSELFCGIFCL